MSDHQPADEPSPVSLNQELTDEEMDREFEISDAANQARGLKALFCNRIFIQPDGLHLRMSFGERVAGESLFHTTIVVPDADALDFGRLIVQMAETSVNARISNLRFLSESGAFKEAAPNGE